MITNSIICIILGFLVKNNNILRAYRCVFVREPFRYRTICNLNKSLYPLTYPPKFAEGNKKVVDKISAGPQTPA